MIAGLIRWSARNLLLILVATIAAVGGGGHYCVFDHSQTIGSRLIAHR